MTNVKPTKETEQVPLNVGSLSNLAGFLDVLIQIDLKNKKTLSGGIQPLSIIQLNK